MYLFFLFVTVVTFNVTYSGTNPVGTKYRLHVLQNMCCCSTKDVAPRKQITTFNESLGNVRLYYDK